MKEDKKEGLKEGRYARECGKAAWKGIFCSRSSEPVGAYERRSDGNAARNIETYY